MKLVRRRISQIETLGLSLSHGSLSVPRREAPILSDYIAIAAFAQHRPRLNNQSHHRTGDDQ